MENNNFLSLKMSSVAMVDEDIRDGNKETVSMRGSRMQWPFSNKVAAMPQFTPYKTLLNERSNKKISTEPLPSPAFMPAVSTGDSFDANQKTYNGVAQMKNFGMDRQGGTHYAMSTFPAAQHVDAHRGAETGTFYMNNPFFKTQVTTNRHNFTPTTIRQQPLGGTPVTTQHSFVPNADQRSKPTGAPAQLTIFYGGSVNVFEDISPEKAQAIMYLAGNGFSLNLAGNGSSLNTNTNLQVPNLKPVGGDVNQSQTSNCCSGLSSPISITSQANGQTGSGSSGTTELIAAKPAATLTAPTSQPEPTPKALLCSTPVPQARKASLARFLERRKERVINTMPYTVNKNSTDGSNGVGVSENAGVSMDLSWCLGLVTKNDKNNENAHTRLDM